MPVHTWKYVYTHCPTCNRLRRVIVTYPTWNGPFRDTTHECDCGTTFRVSDPHKYDQEGYIIEGGPHTKCNCSIVPTAANT
jgi:hypothetical protein